MIRGALQPLRSFLLLIGMLCALSGCETFQDIIDWMGGGKDKTPLEGTRIAVLSSSRAHPDESLSDRPVIVPELKANDNWRQNGGSPQDMTGNLQISGFTHHDSAKIGEHNGWQQPLYPDPIVAGGVVYAMDSKGYITAHDAMNIGTIRWTNNSAVTENEPDLLGGGLAFDGGKLFATSGRGKVFAIDAASGKELWKQTLGVPMRAAPKAADGRVFILSVDNQLFALDAATGTQLWSNRGMNESADFLASISPTVTDNLVIAPYSSGQIHILDSSTGQELWTDSLIVPKRTSATGTFSGIGGNVIVKDDTVYAVGSSGFFAAMALQSGRRLWEQDISSLNTPWIAGDFIYTITSDNELVCMLREDGRVKWMQQLPRYEDDKKRRHPRVWRGPVMANGQLLVTGMHGQMLVISPKDGTTVETVEIPENVTDTPVIAQGRIYMLTQDAKLHVLY